MSKLKIMILCGRSPRHLYVANKLCTASLPVAIVQEVGTQWTTKKVLKLLRPDNFFRKLWRWLRDRRRYIGGGEGKFFFGTSEPKLARPDLVVEVPHINHSDVTALAEKLQPDVIAVFGSHIPNLAGLAEHFLHNTDLAHIINFFNVILPNDNHAP